MLTYLDTRIQKSKVITLDEIDFYLRQLKNIIYIYEVSTKVLVLVSTQGKDKTINYLHKNINIVKEYLNESRTNKARSDGNNCEIFS